MKVIQTVAQKFLHTFLVGFQKCLCGIFYRSLSTLLVCFCGSVDLTLRFQSLPWPLLSPRRLWFDVSDGTQPGADAVDLLGKWAGPAQQAFFFELFLASEITQLMEYSSTLTVIFIFWSSSLLTVLHYIHITFITLRSYKMSSSQSDFGSCDCVHGVNSLVVEEKYNFLHAFLSSVCRKD